MQLQRDPCHIRQLTFALTRSTRDRREAAGSARLAWHTWQWPGCTRTADEDCMLVKLDDMLELRTSYCC